MIRRARTRLSYANVVATLALFLAIGGSTAVAVNQNSVGSRELQKDAVKGRHVDNDKIKGKHVKEEKLKGKHVKDGTIEGSDVAESTLGKVPGAEGADVAANAFNAGRLDGFNAAGLVRVAGDASSDPPDQNGDALTAQITAPRAGFLHIVGSVNMTGSESTADFVNCTLRVDGSFVDGALREPIVGGSNANSRELCTTNVVDGVSAGAHEVDLTMGGLDADTFLLDGALNVLFVPFDGTGS